MHGVNQQLEGLCLAIASINRLLVAKGLVTQEELDTALEKAEATARGEDWYTAVCLPIRILQVANDTGAERPWSVSKLAKLVADKEPHKRSNSRPLEQMHWRTSHQSSHPRAPARFGNHNNVCEPIAEAAYIEQNPPRFVVPSYIMAVIIVYSL